METPLIDMPKLRDRMEGDRDLIREVFEVFVEEAPQRSMKFEEALSGMDSQSMVMLAHALKGASGTLHAEPLRQASYDLELAARANDEGAMREATPRVLAFLHSTVDMMRELLPTI